MAPKTARESAYRNERIRRLPTGGFVEVEWMRSRHRRRARDGRGRRARRGRVAFAGTLLWMAIVLGIAFATAIYHEQ